MLITVALLTDPISHNVSPKVYLLLVSLRAQEIYQVIFMEPRTTLIYYLCIHQQRPPFVKRIYKTVIYLTSDQNTDSLVTLFQLSADNSSFDYLSLEHYVFTGGTLAIRGVLVISVGVMRSSEINIQEPRSKRNPKYWQI